MRAHGGRGSRWTPIPDGFHNSHMAPGVRAGTQHQNPGLQLVQLPVLGQAGHDYLQHPALGGACDRHVDVPAGVDRITTSADVVYVPKRRLLDFLNIRISGALRRQTGTLRLDYPSDVEELQHLLYPLGANDPEQCIIVRAESALRFQCGQLAATKLGENSPLLGAGLARQPSPVELTQKPADGAFAGRDSYFS